MSRVRKPNKWVNSAKYTSEVTGPSKVVRIHSGNEDYHKAKSLAQWLFMKYDMKYKTFTRKSKKKKDILRQEYIEDIKGAHDV